MWSKYSLSLMILNAGVVLLKAVLCENGVKTGKVLMYRTKNMVVFFKWYLLLI